MQRSMGQKVDTNTQNSKAQKSSTNKQNHKIATNEQNNHILHGTSGPKGHVAQKKASKVKQKPKPKSNHSNRSKSHGPQIGKTTKTQDAH